MADFDVPFANANGSKRPPTGTEQSNGFPCGPLDRDLFNWLFYATQAEINAVLLAAGLTPSNADFTQLLQALKILFPVKQTTDVTLYVRTDGNDTTGDGSANTAAKAFLTIKKAIEYGGKNFFLPNGVSLKIQLGNAGTYAAPNAIYGPASVTITGNVSTPSTYVISGAGSSTEYAILHATGSNVGVSGVTINNTGTSSFSVAASNGFVLGMDNVRFTTSSVSCPGLMSSSNGSINVGTGCVAAGSAGSCFNCQLNGVLGIIENFVITGSQTFTFGTATCNTGGIVTLRAPTVTVTGTVTGPKFALATNGMISTGGNGVNYFPGSTAGTIATGGQYS